MRCQLCQNLTLSRLVTLAEDAYTDIYSFPSSSFYRHHTSIHALRHSVESGCELCLLLLKALPSYDKVRTDDLHAKRVSDIRIAISPSHVITMLEPASTRTRDTSDVRMFDFLLVRAGDWQSWYSSPHSAGLMLLSPAGTALGRYQVGRDILDSRLSAQSNFAIIRRWLAECTSKHQACPDLRNDLLPTRVVDVGGDGSDYAPFLLVSDGTARGRYAALTHCWGGKIDVVLTRHTLADFQQRIPVESLAKNFKDALYICRELRVQYLWIDCLCIIQDSEDDWATESSKMTFVYSHAFVTISALASRGSSSGIFRDHHSRRSDEWGLRPPQMRVLRDLSMAVTVALDSSPESGELVYALPVDSVHSPESLQWLHGHSPLTQRAWCLQESLLSPRIVFFGEEQVYWRCFVGFQSADGLPMGNPSLYPNDHHIRLAHGFSGAELRPILARRNNMYCQIGSVYDGSGYRSLIEDYSTRKLTKPSDKLPAFSALAERIHANVGGDYLAGLFTANLHSDLLWGPMVKLSLLGEMEGPESPSYVAPSWSWASAYGEVDFSHLHRHDFMLVDYTAPQRQLKLIDSKIKYRDGTNPYGQVLPGSSIIVAGLTARLVISKQVVLESEEILVPRPKGMCVCYIHWDKSAEVFKRGQVLFKVSSRVGEGETCAQKGRVFYVATKDSVKFKPGYLDTSEPEEGCEEVCILPELFVEDDLLILVLKSGYSDGHMLAKCLVLQKTDQDYGIGQHEQQAPAYRRVGTLITRSFHEDVDFEEMTLEIRVVNLVCSY